jgi:sulfite exporter TauE/SafE
MEFALLLSAMALGLAGIPHCAAMCGAPCAALTGRRALGPAAWAFHGARLASYALAGAVAAASVGALAALAQWSPVLRPVWSLVHAAALMLGLWMLWHGRQPLWLESLGRGSDRAAGPAGGWQRMSAPVKAGAAGSLWVAWPCGLLQSALLLAALANGAAGGALVMGGFAVVTAAGLWLGPALWGWLGGGAVAAGVATWAVRLSGAVLAAAAGFALTHGQWTRFAAYCFG